MQRECFIASRELCVYEWLSSHRHVSHSPHALTSRRLFHQAKYILLILDGLRVCVQSHSSPINVCICFTDLTLSHFPKKPSLIQLPRTMHFVFSTINQPPLLVETPQCVEAPSNTALRKCVEQSNNTALINCAKVSSPISPVLQ